MDKSCLNNGKDGYWYLETRIISFLYELEQGKAQPEYDDKDEENLEQIWIEQAIGARSKSIDRKVYMHQGKFQIK